MQELKSRIYDESNGLAYTLVGDVYLPMIELDDTDNRPIGKWGRMHRVYLQENNSLLYNHLVLSGSLYSYLADLNEQANDRYQRIIRQMMEAEDVTEDLKRLSQWDWIRAMNSIVNRAEEIIKNEIIYV